MEFRLALNSESHKMKTIVARVLAAPCGHQPAFYQSNTMLRKLFFRHLLNSPLDATYKPHKFRSLGQQYFRHVSFQKRSSTTILEIQSGAGGSEAMLFAGEMLDVYLKYCVYKSWPHRMMEAVPSDLGGIKSAKLSIVGPATFENLIQEAGVHRVQRVPKTEKSGRMHTSTIAVIVTPESVLDLKILERDLEWQTMRSSGPGGQHVNKTESAVRVTHKPTKTVAECQETRSQLENRKLALKKLEEKLQLLEMEKLTSQSEKVRRAQQGGLNRNEKIRTYNFPQDRITDHRIHKSYHNLRGLIAGEVSILDKIIADYNSH